MKNPVIIFGAGGIGRAALEIFESHGIVVYGFLDDDKNLHGKEIDHVSVLGRTDDDGFLKLIGKKTEAFVATDDNRLRKATVKMLNERRKVQATNAVHARAGVAKSAELGHGNFINQGAMVGAGAKIKNHCIVHSNAVIEYNASLGDYVQVGAGAVVGAGVELGDEAFVGSGVTIVPGIRIGKKARIGAGSVVIAPVEDGQTVFGNPAAVVEN
jgi:sugar O-acyltransferase (sialic acid O-acetyltransferase NeuD family)